jgi:hypothetical protein
VASPERHRRDTKVLGLAKPAIAWLNQKSQVGIRGRCDQGLAIASGMMFLYTLETDMGRKEGTFKNVKLGKDIHRQIKRRGAPGRTQPARRAPKPGRTSR